MPNHISSSMYTPDMHNLDIRRLKAFLKGIVIAQKKIKEKEIAREELKKHIGKVRKIAEKKRPSVASLKKHVADIEDKVDTVLNKEAKLLRSSAYENKTIAELRRRVKELEEEIELKDSERDNLSRINKEGLDSLNKTIDMLQEKIDNYILANTERGRKINELEDKIKRKVVLSNNSERISALEEKYKELEDKGVHDEEVLVSIRRRIDQLKTDL